jgi:hypothetical protein
MLRTAVTMVGAAGLGPAVFQALPQKISWTGKPVPMGPPPFDVVIGNG